MTLHPGAKFVLDAIAASQAAGQAPMEEMTPEEGRQFYLDSRSALSPEPADVALSEDLMVPGEAGDIPVRHYRPAGAVEGDRLPAVVFFHGGGWVIGDLDSHDVVCRGIANHGGLVVFAVDYRMGPENKFPAAVNDAMAVTRWVAAGAAGRAIDGSRIALCGDSAGGNLAAVVAIQARDENGPKIGFQALIYPSTSLDRDTASHQEFSEGYLLTAKSQDWFRDHYLNSPDERDDWRASPMKRGDLANLPPTLVLTAGYDPLRDEGKDYADLLDAAGVPSSYSCYEGQIHGFVTMGKVIDEADSAIAEVATAIRAAI
jgi:acetyl esterase